ncbi:MAG: hypothetical protein V3U65_13465 [Granulosicoccaceae bacterium]
MSDIPSLSNLASAGASSASSGKKSTSSWYEAMAEAWGVALDKQAGRIEDLATGLQDAQDETPSKINELTAESLRMGFLSNSSHTSLTSVASALETMARKQ